MMKYALFACLFFGFGACTPLPFRMPIETRILPIAVESVVFNPLSNGKTIYVSGSLQGKVLRSDDTGKTWDTLKITGISPRELGDVTQLVCPQFDTSSLYAVVRSNGLFSSHDGGKTWAKSVSGSLVRGEPLTVYNSTKTIFFSGYYACA